MTSRFIGSSVAAFALAAGLSLSMVSISAAQRGGANPEKAATPRTASGHPDMTGFYAGFISGISQAAPDEKVLTKTSDGSIFYDYAGAEGGGGHPDDGATLKQHPNQPSYKPEYMAKVNAIAAKDYGGSSPDDPQMSCKPLGVPRAGVGIVQIVQNDQYIALLYESAPGPAYRIIYTDGRKHPTDLDTSYFGHSIGHWEGDSLVVDTVGLNDETWLGGGVGGQDIYSSIHSDKEHVTERFTRKGNDLTYEATVDDPVMFTKPWVITPRHTSIAPTEDYIQPEMCNTNDKAHIIAPSAKDQYQCNFCQKDPDGLYGQGATDKNAPKGKAPAGGGE
jgi:hypothetical protein